MFPGGGTKNYSFSTYDSHSELCDALRLTKGYRKNSWGYFLRADILSFDEGTLHRVEYEDTESYQVMEMFINSREYLLRRLLSEDE